MLSLAAGSGPAAGHHYLIHPDGSGDFPTISAALAAAVDGDTISLSDGIFTGPENQNLNFAGKQLTVRSLSGDPERCILDCGPAPGRPPGPAPGPGRTLARGFWFHSGEGPDARIEGIWIRNGRATDT